MTDKQVVADDLVVSLDYTLRLDDGEVIATSADGEPLEFLQGHDQIIPGLQQALYGMIVGEERAVVVPPAQGYGEVAPDAFQVIPLDAFPQDMSLEPGMALELLAESGEPLLALVSEVRSDSVVLDLNHPLAGQALHFRARIAGLRPATSEELARGHAH
jgi:FKBP-type peptidyl-prolyl cis-trans isomerase SlyD